jgi:hypothetical protein
LAERAISTPRASATEVFLAFLKLGLTSFGGPIAHLGYFREEFVTRRQWLGERAYNLAHLPEVKDARDERLAKLIKSLYGKDRR